MSTVLLPGKSGGVGRKEDSEALLGGESSDEEVAASSTRSSNRRHLWPKDAIARAVGAKLGSVGSAELSIRMAFLRKVFGILTAQVLVTVGICTAVYNAPNSHLFIQHNSWVLLPSLLFSIGLIIALHLRARDVPLNYVLLAAFTITQALTLGCLVSMYQVRAVLEAALLTLVIVAGLFVYTLQTKRDFKKGHALGFSLLSLLLLASLFQIVLASPAYHFLVNVGGASLFCFFIVLDLDMLMTELEAEDYILACVTLYLDIINLFVHLLQLLGEGSRQ